MKNKLPFGQVCFAAGDPAARLRGIRSQNKVIEFCYPVKTLPVSVTGKYCALSCAHCGGHFLEGMIPLEDIDEAVKKRKPSSLLISGGCDFKGRVPLEEESKILNELKAKNLKLNFHTGFVDKKKISVLKNLADTVSIDFMVDDFTIKNITGKTFKSSLYIESYRALKDEKIKVFPHITIGINRGILRGEKEAIVELAKENPPALVFLVFVPTRGTVFENCKPPGAEKVEEIFSFAREYLPSTPFYLGCMRPGGKYRDLIDELALKYGFEKIVMPSTSTVRAAENLGYEISCKKECCVL